MARHTVLCITPRFPLPIPKSSAKYGLPMASASIKAFAKRFIGSRRKFSDIESTIPVAFWTDCINRQAVKVNPIGFSTMTCNPARIASIANV